MRPVGRGGRELRGGAAAARLRASRCWPTRARAAARGRRGRQRLARRLGRRAARGASRRWRWSIPAGTSATRPPPTAGIAATTAPVVAVCNADLEVDPGTAAAMLARFDAEPDLAAAGPALRNPDGSQYPSARAHASSADAVGHAVLGRVFPRNRFTRRYRQLDADWDRRPRRRLGVGGADLPPPQRARLGRRVGRAVLHVHGGRRPVLAPAPARVAGRVRARRGGRCTCRARARRRHPYRMIVEHHRSVYRFADAALAGRAPAPAAAGGLLPDPCARPSTCWRGPWARAPRRPGSAGNLPTRHAPVPDPLPARRQRSKYRKPKRQAQRIVRLERRHRRRGHHRHRGHRSSCGAASDSCGGAARRVPPTRPPTWPATTGTPRSRSTSAGSGSAAQPQFEKPADNPNQQANVGIHTHGDGLIHTHPFVVSEEGEQRQALEVRRLRRLGGVVRLDRRVDRARSPKIKQTEWSNGDTCPFGQYKGKKGELTWAVDGKTRTGNPADYHMKDGETLAHLLPAQGRRSSVPAERVHCVQPDHRQLDREPQQELAVRRDRRDHHDVAGATGPRPPALTP